MLPSELEGTPPPPGTPNYYVRMIDCDLFVLQGPCGLDSSDRIEVREFQVDWGVPANTTFGNLTTLFPADFSSDICAGANLFNNCIDQPGGGTDKEALSVWPMAPANYRNFGDYESLVFNHTADVDGNGLAGIRWYELRRSGGAWSIYQQGTYSPPDGTSTHRWMGSIGMDKMGNIALGYSASNATNVFPGIRYAGRLATDPLGLLPSGEITLVNGGSSTGGTRWGDYSAMRVDPVDECTFWYTTEYNDATGQTTRIGAFRFPSCNPVDLSISKSANPDPAIAGGQLFYEVVVENDGPSVATDFEVIDTLPAGVEYVTDTDSCTQAPVGTLTCELGDIDPGESAEFTIKVLIDADLIVTPGPSTITNTASVSSNEEDTDESNNETSLTTIVEDSADFKITKLCKPDGPLLAGETGICEIFIDNLGPSDARNVYVNDTHVSEGSFTISSVTPDQGFCNVPANGVVECMLGTLPAGAPGNRATITIEITGNEAVDVNDTAIVSSDSPDPNTGNNMAMGSISISALADLALTKGDSPDPVIAGETLTYDLEVSNSGPSTAVNVLIEDIVPAGVTIDSVIAFGAGACNAGVPGDSTQPTTCFFNSIASGSSDMMQIVVSVLPDTRGVLHNDAQVSSATFDNNNANDLATEETTVDAVADLVVDKSDSPDPVLAGNPLTYTIDVTNNGPSTSIDVMLVDTLPGEVSFDSATATNGGPCNLAVSHTVECELGDLAPGETVTVFIDVTVDPSVPDGTIIINNVVVNSSTADPGGASDSENTLVNAQADLWIDKTGNFPTGNPSGTILYFLTVYNSDGCSEDDPQVCGDGGPSDALDIVVTDALPSTAKKLPVEFVSENCTYSKPAHSVTCMEPVLAAGDQVTFEIQVRAKGSLCEITNVVDVMSSTVDPNDGNNHDELLMTVQGGTGDPGGPKGGRDRGGGPKN